MKKMASWWKLTILAALIWPVSSLALTFPLPTRNTEVVGQVQTAKVRPGDTFATIARRYDLGYTELEEANPSVDPNAPHPGTILIIPTQFILPNAIHQGIVVNLAEMRLYYYPKGQKVVFTYPVGIGREGDETPQGSLRVIQHIVKPTWYVPESIRQDKLEQGIVLPKAVPPGPDNPLGDYAMRLSNMTYLIHGTNDPLGGIGRRSSSGCLRLYPEDIEKLFYKVPQGTKVTIVDEPYKAGWAQGELYLEAHVPLNQTPAQDDNSLTPVVQVVNSVIQQRQVNIDWDRALEIAKEEQGLPQVIGHIG